MRLLKIFCSILAASVSLVGQTYTINTFAGGGLPVNIPGTSARLTTTSGMALDSLGNVFIVANNMVLRLDAATNILTLVAGNGTLGFSGDNGPAVNAQLSVPTGFLQQPAGIAVDGLGNIYIADTNNACIRKVSGGIISTVAGTGTQGFNGDGLAASTQLNFPFGVAVDSNGNLYIADTNNGRIRKLSNGTITTVAGGGPTFGDNGPATNAKLRTPYSVAIDGTGNIYITDFDDARVRRVSTDGTITTVAGNGTIGYSGDGGPAVNAELHTNGGLAVDSLGNLFIADMSNSRVRKVSNGIITTVAGNGSCCYSGDGGLATSAQLAFPASLALDSRGNLIIADLGNGIRKVSNGIISTIAGGGSSIGDNGPATSAQLSPGPSGVDAAGNLFIADGTNLRIRKVSNGVITTVAGTGKQGYSGDNGPATNAQFYQLSGLAVDSTGNLYVADAFLGVIRKISNGIITTIAGAGTKGSAGDNGPAISAQLSAPAGIAVDAAGNLYIADFGTHSIRKVSNGIITTVAGTGSPGFSGDDGPATSAQLSFPQGVSVDSSGNLYIVDYGNQRIRKVSNGVITTVAGNGSFSPVGDNGPATSAGIFPTGGIVVDSAGNVLFSDIGTLAAHGVDSHSASVGRVRRISNGVIATVAGGGSSFGDGGFAADAQLSSPGALAMDAIGRIYVTDGGDNRIRTLTPTGVPCAYAVSPTSLQAPAAGGTFAIGIQALPGCQWTFSGLPTWITASGSNSGTGSSSVNLIVSANTGAARSATISIAGTTLGIAQASGVLTITTPTLVPGATGLAYSQTLAVTGGTAPYSWTVTSGSVPGLTLSSSGNLAGTPTIAGNYSLTVKVTDASSLTSTQSFPMTVVSASTPVRTGALAHIAAGGAQWTTIITIFNTSSSPVAVSVVFHQDDGTLPTAMPVTTTQQGVTQTTTGGTVNAVLNPNVSLLISAGDPSQPQVIGWADVLSSGPVGGFAIFRSNLGTPSEGTVLLQTQLTSTIVLPYDNTNGFVMGVALANLSATSATVTATMLDDSGNSLGTQPITIAGSGHTSFVLSTQLPATAGKRGIIRFQSNGNGGLSGLGLRFSPFGTFTSVPTIPQ